MINTLKFTTHRGFQARRILIKSAMLLLVLTILSIPIFSYSSSDQKHARVNTNATAPDLLPATCITTYDATCPYAGEQNAFGSDLRGQCTWYVYGRVQELVASGFLGNAIGVMFYEAFWDKSNRNAKNWDTMIGGEWIKTSTVPLPIEKRKAGLLVVWDNDPDNTNSSLYGHVALVEEVNADKSMYRISDFNWTSSLQYQDTEWLPFVGNDSRLGVFPKFLDLTYAKDNPEILTPKDGETNLPPSAVTFTWNFNNPAHTIATVRFSLKEALGYGGPVGYILSNRKDIGNVTKYLSSNIEMLEENQWYKWWVEVNFNDSSAPTGAGGYFKTSNSGGIPIGMPKIGLSSSHFNLGAIASGPAADSELLFINNIGKGTLNWTTSSNSSWLMVSPASGTNSGTINISVNTTGLSSGTYNGQITISDPNAINSPRTVTVVLDVHQPGMTLSPFGDFSTPKNGSTVRGSVPVTGWALDDVGIESVKLYNGNDYIGDAILVEGARPDIEQAYPNYPRNSKAGWGYMLLTHSLPNGGNGTYTFKVKATDKEGNTIILGSHTIYCDNANAIKPFGAIDTPTQGGPATGKNFVNWGWALTPNPNMIPTDGSTLMVVVDGVEIGKPVYNLYRSDIAELFPGYLNSSGAVGYRVLDTTTYRNGIHTIQWLAQDNAGNMDGIGSRYFIVQNTGNNPHADTATTFSLEQIAGMPVDNSEPIQFKIGFDKNGTTQTKKPGVREEKTSLNIRENEMLTLYLGKSLTNCQQIEYKYIEFIGFMISGQQLKPLPIGSTLDFKNGIFYWLPGPGFAGEYQFVFITKSEGGTLQKKNVNVTIHPKF